MFENYSEYKINDDYIITRKDPFGFLVMNRDAFTVYDWYKKGITDNDARNILNNYNLNEIEINKFIDYIKNIDSYFSEIDSVNSEPVNEIYISLTDMCNISCFYCYKEYQKKYTGNTDIKIIKKILPEIKNKTQIILTGGEPFLNIDVYEIINILAGEEKIINIEIITNGTLKIDYSKLSEDGRKKIRIIFSVDEPEDLDNEILLNNIKESISNKLNFFIKPVISTINIGRQKELAEKINKLSKDTTILYTLIQTLHKTQEKYLPHLDDWIKLNTQGLSESGKKNNNIVLKNHVCNAGKSCLFISAQGDIYPCQSLVDDEFKMGNIMTDSIDTVLNKREYGEEISNIINLTINDRIKCKECGLLGVCGGGCPATEYYMMKENMDFKETYCEYLKTLSLKNLVLNAGIEIKK